MSDLISRKEAIEEIKKLAEKYADKQTTDSSQFYVGEEDGCYSAIYILEKMKSVEPRTGRWIPCEERTPDDVEGSYGCIATIMNTDTRTGEEVETLLPYPVGYDGKIWIDDEGCECPFEVIAWMPLPKPYENGKE